MRAARLGAVLLPVLLGACGATLPPPPQCVDLYRQYDRLERSGRDTSYDSWSGTWEQSPRLSRQARLLMINDCLTGGADLDLEGVAARHPDFQIVHGGAAIKPVPVHLGVLTAFQDEWAVTQTFRGLGYRSRGIGAEGLGRRIYIGPFTDQAALDQALALAREAGFVAPYAATQTRF